MGEGSETVTCEQRPKDKLVKGEGMNEVGVFKQLKNQGDSGMQGVRERGGTKLAEARVWM